MGARDVIQRLFHIAPALIVVMSLAGCGECRKDGDCDWGQSCVNGTCVTNSGVDTSTDADAPDATDTAEDTVTADTTGDSPTDVPADTPTDTPTDTTPETISCTTSEDCDDENICTRDVCSPALVCVYFDEDGALCGDDLYCNGFEVCSAGECITTDPPDCTDENPCVEGTCDEETDACAYEALADGADCDNGIFCDGSDQCQEGYCQPSYDLRCDDHSPCTVDTCDAELDECVYETITLELAPNDCPSTILTYVSGYEDNMSNYVCGGTTYPAHTLESLHPVEMGSATSIGIEVVTTPEDTTSYVIYAVTDECDPSTCVGRMEGRSGSISGLPGGTIYLVVERDRLGGAALDVTCM